QVPALRDAASAALVLVLALALARGEAADDRLLVLAAAGAVWIGAALVPVHNMLWMGPTLGNCRYLYLADMGFALAAAGLLASVPALGLGAAVPAASRDSTGAVERMPGRPRGPALRYRFVGGATRWTRDVE